MEYTDVLYEVSEGIATITINRADRLNCFRGRTIEELIHAFKRAWADKGAGAVILTAAGTKAFCVGGDQKEMAEKGAYAKAIPAAIEGVTDPLERLTKAVDAYCRVVARHRAATVLAYRSTKSLSPERRLLVQERESATNAYIAEAAADCVAAGLIQPVNIDVLTYQMVLIAHGWALKGWFFKSRLTLDEYIGQNVSNLLSGVLTARGGRRFAASPPPPPPV